MESRLRLKFGEIELEVEGDENLIERERDKFYSLLPQAVKALPFISASKEIPQQITATNDVIDVPINIESKPNMSEVKYETLAQFLRDKSFSRDTEIVLGVAYYLTIYENMENFTAKDIELKLAASRFCKKLTNVNASINSNISNGFIEKSNEKKDNKNAYYLLESGKVYCNNYTQAENQTKPKINKSKRSVKQSEAPIMQISVDELHIDKYCDITTLAKITEQIWVLMYMYTKETIYNSFTLKEIQSILINKFSLPATEKPLRNFFKKTGTKVDKTKDSKEFRYKLLQGGFQEAERIISENQ